MGKNAEEVFTVKWTDGITNELVWFCLRLVLLFEN